MALNKGEQTKQNRRIWLDKWWSEFKAFLKTRTGSASNSQADGNSPVGMPGSARPTGPAGEAGEFSIADVLAFLQAQREAGKAAWQRVQIVDAIAL